MEAKKRVLEEVVAGRNEEIAKLKATSQMHALVLADKEEEHAGLLASANEMKLWHGTVCRAERSATYILTFVFTTIL